MNRISKHYNLSKCYQEVFLIRLMANCTEALSYVSLFAKPLSVKRSWAYFGKAFDWQH